MKNEVVGMFADILLCTPVLNELMYASNNNYLVKPYIALKVYQYD